MKAYFTQVILKTLIYHKKAKKTTKIQQKRRSRGKKEKEMQQGKKNKICSIGQRSSRSSRAVFILTGNFKYCKGPQETAHDMLNTARSMARCRKADDACEWSASPCPINFLAFYTLALTRSTHPTPHILTYPCTCLANFVC